MGIINFLKRKVILSRNNYDGQALFFKNGLLYKIIGNQKNWYDPKYIISDGVQYDLSSCDQIKNIPIPTWSTVDVFSKYGAKGMLDYVLRMKCGLCFNRGEKEICSSLLWKSTELMVSNAQCAWRLSDFERLIKWHQALNMPTEAENGKKYLQNHGYIIIEENKSRNILKKKSSSVKSNSAKMSASEKERSIVEMTTDEHMQMLKNFPFVWNQKLKKELSPQTHPFCYMNITGQNTVAVKNELSKLNSYIRRDVIKHNIKGFFSIPVDELVFSETKHHGHTKFVCSPITLTGRPSKYPLSIYFTTQLYSYVDSIPVLNKNTTHGEVFYGMDGKINKAQIYFWRNETHLFFYYKTVDGELRLTKLE